MVHCHGPLLGSDYLNNHSFIVHKLFVSTVGNSSWASSVLTSLFSIFSIISVDYWRVPKSCTGWKLICLCLCRWDNWWRIHNQQWTPYTQNISTRFLTKTCAYGPPQQHVDNNCEYLQYPRRGSGTAASWASCNYHAARSIWKLSRNVCGIWMI